MSLTFCLCLCVSFLVVAKVLPQVVPSVTPDDARKLFHESREHGMAIVIVTVKVCASSVLELSCTGGTF